MKDLRSPIALARDEYILGEGQTACDPATLGPTEKARQYLENRIEAAFVAGWNARDRLVGTLTRRIKELEGME